MDDPVFKIAFSSFELDGKIPPGSPIWSKFNASFENVEASTIAIGWMIDEGRAFTTWHARNWRDGANFVCGQHLGVDFDTQGVETTLAHPFVERYAAIVYATPSSTQEQPRSRAVFLLDTPIMQAQNYVRAASALIWGFGGQADRQCRDAARFFYGSLGSMPVCRPHVLPLATVRQLIAGHEEWQARQRKPAQRSANYTPRTRDARDAADLLLRLSPARADDYDTWLMVGMALHAMGDEGLRLWDAWSSRNAKYVPGECNDKWRTFDDTGVTLATVAMWANQDSPR